MERAELILHRGAKPQDTTGFTFDDPAGLIAWAAPDRGVVVLKGPDDLDAGLADVIECWLAATR